MRVDFVHSDLASLSQHRQADGADTCVKFGDSRALRDLGAHVLDDALRDVEIVLPECARRIVHRGPAKTFDHAGWPPPILKIGTEDGIGTLAIGVEPQTMQLAT